MSQCETHSDLLKENERNALYGKNELNLGIIHLTIDIEKHFIWGEGAKYIAEALKVNKTLNSFKSPYNSFYKLI